MTATFQLRVLGSGIVAPTLIRYPASYVIETEDQLTLLGCNGTAITRLLGFEYNYTKVSTICISHQHNGHSSGLCHFVQAVDAMCALQQRKMSPIQIMGPIGITKNLFHDLALHWPELISANYAQKFGTIEGPGNQIPSPDSSTPSITTFAVNHSNDMPSLGFHIKYKDKILVYPGDFGNRQDIDKLLPNIEDADLLILHCGVEEPHPYHLTVNQALEIRKRATPKRLLISHVAQCQLHQVQEQVRYLPNVEVAMDGALIDLLT